MLDMARVADYFQRHCLGISRSQVRYQSQNLQPLDNPHHEALGLGHIPHSQSPGFNGCLPAYRLTEPFPKSQLPLKACF